MAIKISIPMPRLFLFLVTLICAGSSAPIVHAGELLSIGLRFGASHHDAKTFTNTEVVVNYALPWRWQWASDIQISTAVEGSLGVLHGRETTGFIGSVGPSFIFTKGSSPWTLDMGINAALLSRTQFDRVDFGSTLQFISHVGINRRITDQFDLGYRFQHMSNAGISSPNPGLNLHLVHLTYRF